MSSFNRKGQRATNTARHARRELTPEQAALLTVPKPFIPAGVVPLSEVPVDQLGKVEQLVMFRTPRGELDPCEIRFERSPSTFIAKFFDAEGRPTGETPHPLPWSVADLLDHYWPRGWESGMRVPADEQPTAPIVGVVVDEARKPVEREELAHVPAPSLPVPVDEPQAGARPFVPKVGAALPARMTEWERALLGGYTHEQAAKATLDQDEAWKRRVDGLAEYFRQLDERIAGQLEHYVREKSLFDLDQITRRSAWIRQELVERPYQFGPQRRAAVLPRRVPGAFRGEIEASRGELAAR